MDMMKNIIYSICVAAIAVMNVSCIREVFPEGGSLTQSQVSASKSAVKSMIKAVPASMTSSGTIGYYSSYGDHTDFGLPGVHLRLEHMLEDIVTMAENPYYNRFAIYDSNTGQGSRYIYCAYFWEAYYKWIRLVNDVIISIKPVVDAGGEGDEYEQMKDILGQAYAYRAMCYLDLARLFEPKPVPASTGIVIPDHILGLTVPIVDEDMTLEQTKRNPRATREDMYDFILGDLKNAETLMFEDELTFSRPTVQAVYGMYARAYLELEDWANAKLYARKVIDSGYYSPLTQAQWEDPVNGFNSASSNKSWIWGFSLVAENLGNIMTFVAHMSSEASWGYARRAQFGVSVRLYDQIPDTDFRKHSWLDPEKEDFYKYQFSGTAADKQSFLKGSGDMPAAKSYQTLKFRPAMGECNDFNIGNAADYCLMRIEEMYFIEVEATAQLDGYQKGAELLTDFMQEYRDAKYNRQSNSLSDFLKNEMLLQKRIEFWGEGILFYDYKRLDKGIVRKYAGSNHAEVFQLNKPDGRSPQWNIVITRSEFQSNTAIDDNTNNPDPSEPEDTSEKE